MMSDGQILKMLREENEPGAHRFLFQGSGPDCNPRHYKYLWDVAVLSDDRSHLVWFRNLSTGVWATWERTFVRPRCEERHELYYVKNRRVPRWSDAPLRPNSDKFGGEWALPYDDDPDPVGPGDQK